MLTMFDYRFGSVARLCLEEKLDWVLRARFAMTIRWHISDGRACMPVCI